MSYTYLNYRKIIILLYFNDMYHSWFIIQNRIVWVWSKKKWSVGETIVCIKKGSENLLYFDQSSSTIPLMSVHRFYFWLQSKPLVLKQWMVTLYYIKSFITYFLLLVMVCMVRINSTIWYVRCQRNSDRSFISRALIISKNGFH